MTYILNEDTQPEIRAIGHHTQLANTIFDKKNDLAAGVCFSLYIIYSSLPSVE